MSTNAIVEELKKHIADFEKTVETEEIGIVIEVGDGIAKMSGLTKCQAQEMLEFPGGVFGVALNLEEETVGAMILGSDKKIKLALKARNTVLKLDFYSKENATYPQYAPFLVMTPAMPSGLIEKSRTAVFEDGYIQDFEQQDPYDNNGDQGYDQEQDGGWC